MAVNSPRNKSASDRVHAIEAGACGKLIVMGKRFAVEVLDVGEHGVRVSYPFSEWPSEGTPVVLELPRDRGFVRYRATVAYEPETTYVAGLVLHDPELSEAEPAQRCHCRVSTDLSVQVHADPHPRRFNAWVLNLSEGGALLRSELNSEPGDRLAIDLSLPSHSSGSVPARVVHSVVDEESDGGQLLGVQFESAETEMARAISEYVEHHLQAV